MLTSAEDSIGGYETRPNSGDSPHRIDSESLKMETDAHNILINQSDPDQRARLSVVKYPVPTYTARPGFQTDAYSTGSPRSETGSPAL